jgi:signal transduction histidine kinase
VDEYTAKQLGKISEVSRALISSFEELIWSHNPVNDSLQKLLWYVRERLGDLFEGTGTEFRISFPEDIPDTPLLAEKRRNVFLVIKELLHNVLKHAGATHAELKVTISEGRISVTVQDNGVGFDPAAKADTGYGLGNMKKRMKACDGDLKIESGVGKGTRVTLMAPL